MEWIINPVITPSKDMDKFIEFFATVVDVENKKKVLYIPSGYSDMEIN